MTQPLAGIRVADFSHVMAGPYASHLLSLMGAEVIKIESRAGDNFRSYGADPSGEGLSAAFIAANAGKKSIALDLKNSEDQAIARGIIERSDVLLENFRPGVIARLGFAYETVRAYNPQIIFCSVSGYGQDGPYRDWPAIDNIVQATSGMMMLSGDEGDPPMRVGFPIVDTLTGQTAAIAILSALLRRANGGGGGYIDVSMLDASLAFMTSALTPYLATGTPMRRMGNTGYSGLPTASLFTAGDGRQISLGVVQPRQFATLARELSREDWLDDPRYATPEAQRANFNALHAELAAEFAKRDAADWERSMSAQGIPCGMVRRVDEASDLASAEAMLELDLSNGTDGARLTIPGPGFRMRPVAATSGAVPPRLDEHREEILEWLARGD
ncbi:CaiB/BaiF CoA transferase family protein [Sphingosinithalassobacter sp. CS137]|uniref:CaiB/BaiF CoA transferase family protein n=1 Tax=Sphingosinithalassobacter sp. CS137 TaxID=2762748 RepID=UPI00165E8FF9|nr:CoA transferase [Sphingosinithalassobacter sp. CS137]